MPDEFVLPPVLERLRKRLGESPGRPAIFEGTPARAAVAIIFRVTDGELQLLLIRRAEREDDPWSGHIALPGGRRGASDVSLLETAIRETLEETAVDLQTQGIALGFLDELYPKAPALPSIVITPYVFVLTDAGQRALTVELSHEVAEAFWIPLATLADPAVTRETEIQHRGATWRAPAFMVADHAVWGLTERILRNLLTLLG